MKNLILLLLGILIYTGIIRAQNDTMYLMKSGRVVGYYKVLDVDSIIFYKPSVLAHTVIDIDGNIYNTVTFGTQVWMAENLRTTRYSNGDLIGTTNPSTLDISGESTPKYQWACNDNESIVSTFGRLYTGYAMLDSRNICPTGWHVPAIAEWTTMQDYLIANGYNYDGSVSGNKIGKSLAVSADWVFFNEIGAVGNTDFTEIVNKSGFSARPTGTRGFKAFYSFGVETFWWSTELLTKSLHNDYVLLNSGNADPKAAISVRCVKD